MDSWKSFANRRDFRPWMESVKNEKTENTPRVSRSACERRSGTLVSNLGGMHRNGRETRRTARESRATPIKHRLTTGCAIFLFFLFSTRFLRSNTRPHPRCTRLARMEIPREMVTPVLPISTEANSSVAKIKFVECVKEVRKSAKFEMASLGRCILSWRNFFLLSIISITDFAYRHRKYFNF